MELIAGGVVLLILLVFAVTHPALAWLLLLSIGSGGAAAAAGAAAAVAAAASRAAAAVRAAAAPRGRGDAGGRRTLGARHRRRRASRRAIAAAERDTSGEIRVALSRFYFWGDVRRAAERAFARLHMDRTRAPQRRADLRGARAGGASPSSATSASTAHVTATFWNDIADDLAQAFRAGDPDRRARARDRTAIGERLAQHFPPDPGAGNELPDQVVV